MRRVLALLTVGLALFFATACGGDDGGNGETSNGETNNGGGSTDGTGGTEGTASVEEVCADVEETADTLDTDGQELRGALTEAVESGDQAAIDEASASYREFGSGLAQDLRDIAATSADPDLRSAVEAVADEFETLTTIVADDPDQADSLDPGPFQAAAQDVDDICGF
jgi:hypothetical protein